MGCATRGPLTRTGEVHRFNRREVLKAAGALAAGAFGAARGSRLRAHGQLADTGRVAHHLDDYLRPFPGKRALLATRQLDSDGIVQDATSILPTMSTTRIVQVTEWPVGAYPNYCDSAVVGNRQYVWVASFGAGVVTRIDALSGAIVHLPTGPGTLPLDVAYDSSRKRVVVASADDEATMVVLDSLGNTVVRKRLVEGIGQGLSDGGAQGVAVDSEGDYWFSLAYFGAAPKGVVVKVDGDTLEPVLHIKDVGLNNPNGILFAPVGPYILALSDNGVAHQFGIDGTLLNVLETTPVGYRGDVRGKMLWVASWSADGQMARVDLSTGQRQLLPCVPLANSVTVDNQGRIWVAGDAGASVSAPDGTLLAMSPVHTYSNGLTTLSSRVYLTSHPNRSKGVYRLNQVTLLSPRVRIPTVFVSD